MFTLLTLSILHSLNDTGSSMVFTTSVLFGSRTLRLKFGSLTKGKWKSLEVVDSVKMFIMKLTGIRNKNVVRDCVFLFVLYVCLLWTVYDDNTICTEVYIFTRKR